MNLVGPSVVIALGKPQRVIQDIITLTADTVSVKTVGTTLHMKEKMHFKNIYTLLVTLTHQCGSSLMLVPRLEPR